MQTTELGSFTHDTSRSIAPGGRRPAPLANGRTNRLRQLVKGTRSAVADTFGGAERPAVMLPAAPTKARRQEDFPSLTELIVVKFLRFPSIGLVLTGIKIAEHPPDDAEPANQLRPQVSSRNILLHCPFCIAERWVTRVTSGTVNSRTLEWRCTNCLHEWVDVEVRPALPLPLDSHQHPATVRAPAPRAADGESRPKDPRLPAISSTSTLT